MRFTPKIELRIGRIRAGLTQHDLGDKVNEPQTRISQIERGYVLPTPEEAMKLANAVGTPAEQLFPEVIGKGNGDE